MACLVETHADDCKAVVGDVTIEELGEDGGSYLGRGTDETAFLIGIYWLQEDDWQKLYFDPGWEEDENLIFDLELRLRDTGHFITENLPDVWTGLFRKTPSNGDPFSWYVHRVDGRGHGVFEGMQL